MDRLTPAEVTASASAARYVHELGGQLSGIARTYRLDFLAYLLELAVHEAEAQARALEAGDVPEA